MKYTRLTALVLAAMLVCLAAVSCGTAAPSGEDTTAADTTAADTTAEPEDGPSVGEITPEYSLEVAEPANPLKIFVTAGADGSVADGSEEHPYATLEAGRDAAKAADKTGYDSVDIIISGSFFRTETFTLSEEDSGTAECRIRYIGTEGAEITGGVTVPASDFAPVTDAEYLSYFEDGSKDKILTVDLKKYGVSPEDVAFQAKSPYPDEGMNSPFLGSTRLHLARYPDGKYISLGNMESEGEDENKTYDIKYAEIHNTHIEKWHDRENVYITGYFTYYWWADQTKVLSFDTEETIMTVSDPGGYGPEKGMAYYWYNIPEELNTEGEYYVTEDAVLYFYPTEEQKSEELHFPVSKAQLVVSKADYVTFTGITFEDNVNTACTFYGDGVDFIGNNIFRIGYCAITLEGTNNRIMNCDIENISDSAVTIKGGDSAELVMSGNVAANNRVLYFSERLRCYCGAFKIEGCGNTVTNNEIAHTNHLAILYSGSCNLFQYNNAYDLLKYTDDAGVIYSGRTLLNYSNVIRYNYFHDLGSPDLMLCATSGIYYDDGLSGQIAYGNIIENIAGNGFAVGGGSDNNIHDNLIINAVTAISYDQRYYEQTKLDCVGHDLLENARETFAAHPVYTDTFPTLKQINDDKNLDDPWYWAAPSRNIIKNNYAFTLENNPLSRGNDPFNFSDMLDVFSTVENNVNTYYTEGNQPTVAEALEITGLDIPFDKIGVED